MNRNELIQICRDAHLSRVNLIGANLIGANLSDAHLSRVNLIGANLIGANLIGANLPAPSMLLLANWGSLSDETTLALMRLDCSACPDAINRFDRWAKDNDICPYTNAGVQRVAQFREDAELWARYGYAPPPTLWECMVMVLDEKCPGWLDHKIPATGHFHPGLKDFYRRQART